MTGKPVKWMEDRSENLMSTTFARDYHMHGEIAATKDGKILGLRVKVLADHGAFNGAAQPTKFPAGFFHIFTGSYDLRAAHCKVTGVYTNKAPGGVAYACSFRITEAVYLVERMVDCSPHELEMDPAELRMKNLLRPEQFPYTCPTGWEYDSGDYPRALRLAMDIAGYDELRREQAREAGPRRVHGHRALVLHRGRRAPARASTWTSSASAWPTVPSCGSTRPARPCSAISVQTQGQGHETTFAQIVAEELGIPPDDIEVVHGDTDHTPFGLGTYGSRSTPVSGAAAAVVARKVRDKARIVAAAMLEVSPDDLEWENGRWQVRGDPDQGQDDRRRSPWPRTALELPEGVEGHLDAESVYNPPNLTYPFGAYICVVDVDPGTGEVKVRRFIAVDDCGARINPMIVEGQVHGGLADGVGMALMEVIAFDDGRQLPGRLVHGLPAADRGGVPVLGARRDRHAVARTTRSAPRASASRPPSARPPPWSTPCSTRSPFGVRHADMPLTPANVWSRHAGPPGPHRPGDP